MKKVLAIIVSLVFVVSFAGLSFAAEKAADKKAPAMEEKKAPAMAKKAPVKQVTGEVSAVDAKANTITVKAKKGETTVTADDKTKVMMGKEKKAIADVKVGDKVTVKFSEADGKMVAKSVAIKAADEKAAAKKLAADEKAAAKKKAADEKAAAKKLAADEKAAAKKKAADEKAAAEKKATEKK